MQCKVTYRDLGPQVPLSLPLFLVLRQIWHNHVNLSVRIPASVIVQTKLGVVRIPRVAGCPLRMEAFRGASVIMATCFKSSFLMLDNTEIVLKRDSIVVDVVSGALTLFLRRHEENVYKIIIGDMVSRKKERKSKELHVHQRTGTVVQLPNPEHLVVASCTRTQSHWVYRLLRLRPTVRSCKL